MSSFASVKGPSTTVRLLPEYLTRQPFELGFKPDASSSTPAFCSSSWYFCISDISLSEGMTPASESFVALTIIMNRIVFSVELGAGPPDGSGRKKSLALTVRRTKPCEIDSLNELFLVVDRLVGGGPEIAIDRRCDRRIPDALGHEDAGHVLPGVGVPRCPVTAAANAAEAATDFRNLRRSVLTTTPPSSGTLRGVPESGASPRQLRSS